MARKSDTRGATRVGSDLIGVQTPSVTLPLCLPHRFLLTDIVSCCSVCQPVMLRAPDCGPALIPFAIIAESVFQYRARDCYQSKEALR